MPQFPPGSPFEKFFHDFLEHGLPKGDHPDLEPRKATSLGSGFIIDPAGYIVTNNHVIADADEITVILHDNTNLKAKVVGRDTKTDIALLKVKADKPLPAVAWGDSDVARVGDWVLAIGNPFGLGGSVTAGILSARQRDINSGPYDDFLQTDAPINRGNSGGPMFNMDGQVIGINTAIYSPSGGSIGIGFAIPSALAKEVVAELKDEADHTVHRGWLGVRIQAVTDEIAESLGLDKARGALVASVSDKGPAQAAGYPAGRRDPELRRQGCRRHAAPAAARRRDAGQQDRRRDAVAQARRDQVQVKVGQLEESDQQQASAQEAPKKTRQDRGRPGQDARPDPLRHHARPQGQVFAGRRCQGRRRRRCRQGQLGRRQGRAPRRPDHGGRAGRGEKPAGCQPARIDEAKKSGRKSILLLVERQGDLRFVALRLDQGEHAAEEMSGSGGEFRLPIALGVEEAGQIGMVETPARGGGDRGFGAKGDAEAGGGQHRQIVGAVADRDRLSAGAMPVLGGERQQRLPFGLAGHDRRQHPAGEPARRRSPADWRRRGRSRVRRATRRRRP